MPRSFQFLVVYWFDWRLGIWNLLLKLAVDFEYVASRFLDCRHVRCALCWVAIVVVWVFSIEDVLVIYVFRRRYRNHKLYRRIDETRSLQIKIDLIVLFSNKVTKIDANFSQELLFIGFVKSVHLNFKLFGLGYSFFLIDVKLRHLVKSCWEGHPALILAQLLAFGRFDIFLFASAFAFDLSLLELGGAVGNRQQKLFDVDDLEQLFQVKSLYYFRHFIKL